MPGVGCVVGYVGGEGNDYPPSRPVAMPNVGKGGTVVMVDVWVKEVEPHG